MFKWPDNQGFEPADCSSDRQFHLLADLVVLGFQVRVEGGRSIEIPKEILDLIREKRKARRNCNKTSSPESRQLFNKLNLQVKERLQTFRQANLEAKFADLENFSASCSIHWKIINNLQTDSSTDTLPNPTTLYEESTSYSSKPEISEKFGSILAITFGAKTHRMDLQQHPPTAESPDSSISMTDFTNALKDWNKKAAAGNDGISNLLISQSPNNIKLFILKLFHFSLKLGYIYPKSWKAAKIIMIHKWGMPKKDFTTYRQSHYWIA